MGGDITTPYYSPGNSVQVVNAQTGEVASGSVAIPNLNVIPINTMGTEFMTLSITPENANNKLKIEIDIIVTNAAADRVAVALFQDDVSTALAVAISFAGASATPINISFTHYMTAGTTSLTTFKVRAGAPTTSEVTFNGESGLRKMGGVMASSITITEIKV